MSAAVLSTMRVSGGHELAGALGEPELLHRRGTTLRPRVRRQRADEVGVLEAAQATETVLAAIARPDGPRASVLAQRQNARERDSILGDFAFDRYGDMTPAQFTVLQVTGTRARPANNLIVDRVIAVPTD